MHFNNYNQDILTRVTLWPFWCVSKQCHNSSKQKETLNKGNNIFHRNQRIHWQQIFYTFFTLDYFQLYTWHIIPSQRRHDDSTLATGRDICFWMFKSWIVLSSNTNVFVWRAQPKRRFHFQGKIDFSAKNDNKSWSVRRFMLSKLCMNESR